ncbi:MULTISPECIES: magnesium transporter [Hyphomonas]|jgi:magnesium transporter|uniref:Magnesium transporter MgtE n=1 Tax=Hyphomonas atlantica TaxID=1280948 RepID=A0A059E1X4_9PROT|nr:MULTISPECIES: magnesium transporter [Hyphomonas]KCZ61638.1 magnesium transporter [Hyphomonas atlantica]MAM05916.1 magnesium transporter [Hyphomonas sp.]HAE95450.1 magnesium transporter [Hyphomonas atlantica]HBF90900.1 magnesium transporter [Hyphomonas atlantica]|tara:strand:+ start:236 stop:1618 length:1383 start_codon:yes stop_codon:yes gene_type:complete
MTEQSVQPAQAAETPNVDPDLLEDIIESIDERDTRWLARTLQRMHPADAADALEALSFDTFSEAVELLGGELPADILIELRDSYREEAVEVLPDAAVASALDELDSDDATTILEDLEDDRRERILEDLAPIDRAQLERGLSYEEESAGRLMQTEFVAAPEYWTVGHAIDHARDIGEELPEVFYELYVIDPGHRLIGIVQLATLLRTARDVQLSDIMKDPLSSLKPDMDQEEVAFQFRKYSLAAAPVTDEGGRLVGMITVDDMVDVMQEENAEDLLSLLNVTSADGADTVWDTVKARAPWLGVNLFTAFIASAIISLFEGAIAQVVALAVLMPVVAALGGNAGSQGLAVAVRAIAERQLDGDAARRAILREVLSGFVNGLIFAIGVGVISLVWFRDIELALVIATAMLATFVWAGLSGILVPLGLKRLGADPAVASSVFVLTLTDVMAFFSFLGLASIVLL